MTYADMAVGQFSTVSLAPSLSHHARARARAQRSGARARARNDRSFCLDRFTRTRLPQRRNSNDSVALAPRTAVRVICMALLCNSIPA